LGARDRTETNVIVIGGSEKIMAEPVKTHWRKLVNPDYLGAYSLDPGKDMILTIKHVKNEMVTGPDGKKEECMVMTFMEPQKPMIVNSTNAKTIEKLYGTPYIEEWHSRKIQLFVDKVKAFGEVVEALRIRPRIPVQTQISTKCTDCEGEITGFENMTAEQVAQRNYSKYGKPLCISCATKLKEQGKVEDPL
jgi:hypothetical protein